jgi:hypothetical protein
VTKNLTVSGYLSAQGGNNIYSSREFKTDIRPFTESDYAHVLDEVGKTDVFHYHYKEASLKDQPHVGVIAEASPREILDKSGKMVSLGDYSGFLLAAVKAQQAQIEAMKTEIQELRREIRETKD